MLWHIDKIWYISSQAWSGGPAQFRNSNTYGSREIKTAMFACNSEQFDKKMQGLWQHSLDKSIKLCSRYKNICKCAWIWLISIIIIIIYLIIWLLQNLTVSFFRQSTIISLRHFYLHEKPTFSNVIFHHRPFAQKLNQTIGPCWIF